MQWLPNLLAEKNRDREPRFGIVFRPFLKAIAFGGPLVHRIGERIDEGRTKSLEHKPEESPLPLREFVQGSRVFMKDSMRSLLDRSQLQKICLFDFVFVVLCVLRAMGAAQRESSSFCMQYCSRMSCEKISV